MPDTAMVDNHQNYKTGHMLLVISLLSLVALFFLAWPAQLYAGQAKYIYDDLGRMIRVLNKNNIKALGRNEKTNLLLLLSLISVWPALAELKTDKKLHELVGNVRTVVSKSCDGEKGSTVLETMTAFDTKWNTTEFVITS